MAPGPRSEPLGDEILETDREEEIADEDKRDGDLFDVAGVAGEALEMTRDAEMEVWIPVGAEEVGSVGTSDVTRDAEMVV